MKSKMRLLAIAFFMAFLIIMVPVCFAQTLNLVYDRNGNLVTGDGFYREYNSLNQLWKVYNGTNSSGVLLETYVYHPIEERVLIKNVTNPDGSWKETVYYISQDFVRVVNASGTYDTAYVYHDGQLIAEKKSDSSVVYYHPDHLGSTTLVTDSGGNLVENSFYTPYGKILSGGSSRFDYTGQEYDSVIGDYDYNARRYNAGWGKFIQPDKTIPNIYNSQSLNRYAYVYDNPYKYADEDGQNPYVVLGIAGFAWGSIEYMLTTPVDEGNSGWKRLGKSYLHGANAGVHALAATTLIFKGGALRIAKGKSILSTAFKGATLAASEYTASQMIENQPINPSEIGKQSVLGMIEVPGSAKGGQYASKYIFTNQNFKFFYEYLASSALRNYVNQLADQQSQVCSADLSSGDSVRNSGQNTGGSSGTIRKQGVGNDNVKYDIPSTATYHPGFWR